MLKHGTAIVVGLVLAGLFLAGAVGAQDKPGNFPRKPVTLYIGWAAGGGSDLMGRAVAASARQFLGQPMVVVNREGAGATICHAEVATMAPDGYSINSTASGVFSTQPLLRAVEYAIDDFDFLIGITREPLAVYVPASYNVSSIAEFTKMFEGKDIIFGTHGAGSIPAFASSEVLPMLGWRYSVVNYAGGSGEVLPALLGEHINAGFLHPHEAQANIDAGTIKCIGIGTEERMPEYPDTPTFKEQGIDWLASVYKGYIMPKGGDPRITAFLGWVLGQAFQTPEFKDFAKKNNVPMFITSGEELKRNIIKQHAAFKAVLEKQKK